MVPHVPRGSGGLAMALLTCSGLERLEGPRVGGCASVTQATAHLHGAWSEPDPAGPPGVQRRLWDREVGRSLVDGEDHALVAGGDGGTHRVLLRDHEERFALVTEGVQPSPRGLWSIDPLIDVLERSQV